MEKYYFTKDINGSNNGIVVEEYKEGQIIEKADLNAELFDAWLEAGILKDAGEPVEAEQTEAGDKPDEIGEDNDREVIVAGDGGVHEIPTELTEEKIGELVHEAKTILEVPEGANLTDEDINKIYEIGVELKIAGMLTSKKPQTILDKMNKYIDEYENAEDEIPE